MRRLRPPEVCGLAFIVLLLSTDLEFRFRDPALALEGVIDLAIAAELSIWLAVSVWIMWHLLPRGRPNVDAFRGTGPLLRTLIAVAALFGVTSLFTGGILPPVRAWQFIVLTSLAVLAHHLAHADPAVFRRFWLTTRRGLWITLAAAVPLALAVGFVMPHASLALISDPAARYELFLTHPITTGGLLGLGIIAMASSWLLSEDPWFARRRVRWFAGGTFAVFLVLLVATKARGALFATLAALALIVAFTPHRTRRGIAVLAGIGAVGLVLAGMGLQLIRDVVTRGQTPDELLSLTGRLELFGIAYDLFRERPLLGYGYQAARSIFLERVPWAGHSHNAWVEVGVNTGLVGLLLVGLLFGLLGLRLVRAIASAPPEQRLWAAEGLALVAFVLVLGVVSAGFAGAPGYETAALVWAVLLAEAASRRPRPEAKELSRTRRAALARTEPRH